jgi:hypothetical protein
VEWAEISGMGRTRTYAAINDGHLTAVKVGRRTLIDVNAGLAWMRGQSYSPSRKVFAGESGHHAAVVMGGRSTPSRSITP